MKTFIGIIPARYESSRFPGKPLIDLKGKSMIQRVYEQSKKASVLKEVYVATDDDRILNHVLAFGGKAVMTSPDHPSGTDRCYEVLQKINEKADVVINIQGDEPLIMPEQISLLTSCFENKTTQIATLIKKFDAGDKEIDNPNRVKVVASIDSNALYFSRSKIPFDQKETSPTYFKHIGIYAYTTKVLAEIVKLAPSRLEIIESLEQLRWLENGYQIKTLETKLETPNIDTPNDVESVLKLIQ